MKNLILIPGKPSEIETFGVRKNYIDFFQQFGAVVVTAPDVHSTEILDALKDQIKLIVLPGGADVSPMNYGIMPSVFTGKSDPFLEYADQTLLPWAEANRVPVFGICRGLQAINTYFGGTLLQDNPAHPMAEHDVLTHSVTLSDPNTKERIKGTVKVNSVHHQCISTVGDNLSPIAVASDGVIEAIVHNSLPMAAVQWHPEFLYNMRWLLNLFTFLGVEHAVEG